MADLWWVSWVLLIAALLGVGAWLALLRWWLWQQRSRTRLEQALGKDLVITKDETTAPSLALNYENTTLECWQTPITAESIIFPRNPEHLMWRPPPRESLLQRQQVKTRLGKPTARLEGARARITAPTPLPALPQVEQALKIAPPDSKIGRKRQGLESLVNVAPVASGSQQDEAKNV